MKNILLIGLGRFGRHLAMELNRLGHQIMAVDRDEERVNECMPFVTNAQIGDSTRLEFLRSLGVGNYDICYVTICGSFQDSLETVSLLKELGAKTVVARADRDVQEKFLLATERTTSPIPKNSLPNGRPPATPPTICSTTLSWTTDMPSWRSPSRNAGSVRLSAS